MSFVLVILAAQAAPAAAPPAEPVEAMEPGERLEQACLAPQAVVPPFNNTREAMEQSRIAAGYVLAEERDRARRRGERADDFPLCGSDLLAEAAASVNATLADPAPEAVQAPADGET